MLHLKGKTRLCPQDYLILEAALSCTGTVFSIKDMVRLSEFAFLDDCPEEAYNVFCSSVKRLLTTTLVETTIPVEKKVLDSMLIEIPYLGLAAITVPEAPEIRIESRVLRNGEKGFKISFVNTEFNNDGGK